MEARPDPNEHPAPPHEPEPRVPEVAPHRVSGWQAKGVLRIAGAALLSAGLIALVWYLARGVTTKDRGTTDTGTGAPGTQEGIRNAFRGENPELVADEPAPPANETATSAPPGAVPQPDRPSDQPAVAGTQSPEPFEYANDSLGFSVSVSGGWLVDEPQSNPNRTVFVNPADARLVSSVEVYEILGTATLDDLERAFRGSPDIVALWRTNIYGTPALGYRARDARFDGISVIRNNRIYHIRGTLSDPAYLPLFKFR